MDLKALRQVNGNITQSELAGRLGITLRTVQKYESGFSIPRYMQKLIRHEFDPAIAGGKQEDGSYDGILEDLTKFLLSEGFRKLQTDEQEGLRKLLVRSSLYKDKYLQALELLNDLNGLVISKFKPVFKTSGSEGT